MRKLLLVSIFLLFAASAARADIVYMRDGSKREGRIVSQNDDVIVLEMTMGGTTAKLTLKRDDVDHIEKKLTAHETIMKEYKTRLRRLDPADADAVDAFAKWCVENKLYDEAETAYGKLMERDEAGFVRGHLALARVEFERGRSSKAKEHLAEVLKKQPGNAEAKVLSKRIAEVELAAVERLLGDAVEAFNERKFDRALNKAETFHDRATEEQKKRLIAATTFPEKLKFDAFVAECRLRRPCPKCEGGADVCSTCKGKTTVDDKVCPDCGGRGARTCKTCGGTGILFDKTPAWELPAVARALETRAGKALVQLEAAKKKLTGKLDAERVLRDAYEADALAARTMGLLNALAEVIEAAPGASTFPVNAEMTAARKNVEAILLNLGKTFGDHADAEWRKAKKSDEGMLAQDEKILSARNDAARATCFYRSLEDVVEKPPADVKGKLASLQGQVAEMDKVIDQNQKLLKALDATFKLLKRNDLARALQVMVEIATHASKADLAELSRRVSKEVNYSLPDLMAHCRFEVGKEKRKFGNTTEYERPAFVKKLLQEADAMAALADAGYVKMIAFRDAGRRNQVPTSIVRNTKDYADNARDWYEAALAVPFPLAETRRKQILQRVEDMDDMVHRCNDWYRGNTPHPPPVMP